MKTTLIALLVSLTVAILPSCTPEEQQEFAALLAKMSNSGSTQRAHTLAHSAAARVLEQMDGGQNLRPVVTAWTYTPSTDSYSIEMEVHWDGAIFASNHYEIDGILSVQRDGGHGNFIQTRSNQNVRDYKGFRFGVGAAIVLGALAAEASSDR